MRRDQEYRATRVGNSQLLFGEPAFEKGAGVHARGGMALVVDEIARQAVDSCPGRNG